MVLRLHFTIDSELTASVRVLGMMTRSMSSIGIAPSKTWSPRDQGPRKPYSVFEVKLNRANILNHLPAPVCQHYFLAIYRLQTQLILTCSGMQRCKAPRIG